MENKGGVLTFGAGSGGLYLKGGCLQRDCRAGTNTGRAGGGAEGNGRMRAEHRVGIAERGTYAWDPHPNTSGAAMSTIWPQRPPCNSQGLQGHLRSVQRPVWHCQAEEVPKGQGGHSCWCPLSSVLKSAGPEHNSLRSYWIKSPSLAQGAHGRVLVSCSSWGQHGRGIQKQWCRAAGSAQSVCHWPRLVQPDVP